MDEWKKCTDNVYRSLGSKVCSKKSIDGFHDYMQHSFIDPLNVIFQCHDDVSHDTNTCSQMNRLITRIKKQKTRYKTPYPAILAISHSIR